jgi:hypothetical protein
LIGLLTNTVRPRLIGKKQGGVSTTSNWWLGHRVLIAPQWIDDVNWFDCKVSAGLTPQAVKDAPPYDAAAAFNRVQEMDMHQHYGRPGYWAVEGESGAAGSRR